MEPFVCPSYQKRNAHLYMKGGEAPASPLSIFSFICKRKASEVILRRFFVLALPIFPGRRQPSIVGAGELNCRVRNGNGWTLTAISTNLLSLQPTFFVKKVGKETFILLRILLLQSLRRPQSIILNTVSCVKLFLRFPPNDPYRIRTDVNGVRGRCLNHLTNGPDTPSGTRSIEVVTCHWHVTLLHLRVHDTLQMPNTPSGTRTLDTLIKSQVLYQLS